jgi:hypothetical protein
MMMSKRVHYRDSYDNSYDIIRLYDGEEAGPLSKVYIASDKKKLVAKEWKPEFQESLFNLSTWPKDSYAIMFSGGFDSLSLALRHLEKGERVFLLSIGFSDEQTTSSLTVKLLKSIYNNAVIGPIKIFAPIYIDLEGGNGLLQQPITAFYASHMPDKVREVVKAVECAYVMNDDAISFQNELKAIYNNSIKCHILDKERPPLKFPLTKVSHEENLEYVASIEKKYQIIFPALSSEYIECRKFADRNNNTLYIIQGGINSDKPNKMCNVSGYLILEKSDRKAFPRLKFKSDTKILENPVKADC